MSRRPADLHIALVGPESARDVHLLTQAAFGGYHWLTPPSGAIDETEDDVRQDLARHGGLLARLEGGAVGALRFVVEPRVLRVRRVAVAPEQQGSGIGRQLMRAAHDHAVELGFAEVRLGVRAQLPGNRDFYERLGYRVIKAHTRPGSDDVVWLEMAREVGTK